jgi:hypothetical protein
MCKTQTQYLSAAGNAKDAVLLHVSSSSERQEWRNKTGAILMVVFPCMLIKTQLKFQINALVLLLKHKNYSFVLMSSNFLTPTSFDPRGSSSGGTMLLPG